MDSHPLRESILDALRCLNQPTELRNSTLLSNVAVRASLGATASNASIDDLALALSERLNAIIEGLRPPGQENLEQREFLYYYILHYLFQRDENPQVVQQKLGIGRTYLYKLRNEAVDNVAVLLIASPSPHALLAYSEPIPLVAGFVGREAELSHYRQQLEQQNLALLHGFAGTGKTALAAQLAASHQQTGQPIFWVTFCTGINDTLQSLLTILADALAGIGLTDLQHFLAESSRDGQPYSGEGQIQYAANCLVASGAALCFDDLHLVEDEPQIQRFLACLLPRQQAARVPLIITSRYFPAFAQGRYIPPLTGLRESDVHQLLHQTGLDWLDEDALLALQQRTEGNPAFVKFFVTWAQAIGLDKKPDVERIAQIQEYIVQLGRSPQSRGFLLAETIGSLTPVAQALLEQLALCRKPVDLQGDRLAAFSPLDDLNAWQKALLELERRNLFVRDDDANCYRLHDLVRNFLLAQLDGRPERCITLHRLLADYYVKIKEPLEAAYHHCQARDFSAAVALLIENIDMLIRDGKLPALLRLAEQIPVDALQPNLRLAWYAKLAVAWQSAGLFEEGTFAGAIQALLHVPQANDVEQLAVVLSRDEAAVSQGQQAQVWDVSFLRSLAAVLSEKIAQADVILRRAQHTETSVLNSAAVASARQSMRQAQNLQGWIADAASYSLALLMAQHLNDGPTQRDAYNQLGRSLTRLGQPQEAAQAYHRAFTWPGCVGLGIS